MDFDIELMAETSERIADGVSKQIEVLNKSHGADFSRSVMGNVGCYLLTCLLASREDEDERMIELLSIIKVLAVNVRAEIASVEADEIIERIKKGPKC